MTDIVEFLRARYAEVKQAAEDASINEARGPHWAVAEQPPSRWGVEPPDDEILAGGRAIIRFDSEYGGALAVDHVLLHDPARVLADIDAKLLLVEEHAQRTVNVADFEQFQAGVVICSTCSYPHGQSVGADEYRPHPCRTLRLLALPFAGHADYDQRWKP